MNAHIVVLRCQFVLRFSSRLQRRQTPDSQIMFNVVNPTRPEHSPCLRVQRGNDHVPYFIRPIVGSGQYPNKTSRRISHTTSSGKSEKQPIEVLVGWRGITLLSPEINGGRCLRKTCPMKSSGRLTMVARLSVATPITSTSLANRPTNS